MLEPASDQRLSSEQTELGTSLFRAPNNAPAQASVLIVDDYPLLRFAVISLLKEEPYFGTCIEAASAAEAMEELRERMPLAALVDVSLPGASGIDLVKMIRAQWPNLPILVFSLFKEIPFMQFDHLRRGPMATFMKSEAPLGFRLTERLQSPRLRL
jgi:DNA-binding NarL/FixJ family response regulator